GANQPGEISHLAGLVEPTIGVITLAAPAHLEGFGSLEGVAAAKGELLDHLPRAGTAVLNADDPFLGEWRARAASGVVPFGFSADADCTIVGKPETDAEGSRFRMRLPENGEIDVRLPLLGRPNVANALAAAAAAIAAGATPEDVRVGLGRAVPVHGRLRRIAGRAGAAIIDDSYNANPASVHAAIDYLAGLPGRRVLVLGDMAELGAGAPRLHAEVGAYARGRCDALVAVGALASHAAESFGPGARRCATVDDAARALEPELAPDLTILVKGSRVMRLERLVQSLAAGGAAARANGLRPEAKQGRAAC